MAHGYDEHDRRQDRRYSASSINMIRQRFLKNIRGSSVIEYIILIVMLLTAILVMQKQIARGFFGRWKNLGDTFGHGEQYDPTTTLECGRFVPRLPNPPYWGNEIWYNQKPFDCCRYINAAIGNYATSCSGFSGNVETCRNKPTEYEKTKCCAEGSQSTACTNLTP